MSEFNFNMDVNTSLRLLTGGKYCDRDIVITVQEEPETGGTVAKIGNSEYKSVAKALANAASGDTVIMVADSDESGKTLVIPAGVTLNLQGYTLTAERVVGVDGSYLAATTKTNTVAGGKLVVDIDNLELAKAPFINTAGSSSTAPIFVLPVWDTIQNCYVFSRIRTNHRGFSVENDTLNYEFGTTAENYANKTLFIDGSANNRIQFALHVSWERNGATYNLEFIFSEESVASVASGGHVFTVTITGLSSMGLTDLTTLKVTPVVISGSGAVATGITQHGA